MKVLQEEQEKKEKEQTMEKKKQEEENIEKVKASLLDMENKEVNI
jgi:hypothetical protein